MCTVMEKKLTTLGLTVCLALHKKKFGSGSISSEPDFIKTFLICKKENKSFFKTFSKVQAVKQHCDSNKITV